MVALNRPGVPLLRCVNDRFWPMAAAPASGQRVAVSIRSVLARRCSRDIATLVAWITWASMPRARSQRANQKLSRPVSYARSEEHTSELQSHSDLVCRLLLEKKKKRVRRP